MRHNKFLRLFFLLFAIILMGSCKKYIDINTDPTTATSVDGKLLFGYAVTYWNENRDAGDIYIPLALASQTIASGGNYGWGADNIYKISPTSLGNTWTFYYQRIGNNLQLAIKAFQAAGNKNAVAQSQIVLAQLVYELAVIFGDVPYSEAWNSSIPYPKYDAQKDVFESILKLLDGALASMDVNNGLKISDYDPYYAGDISKWIKLANSIKLRILMTMVDADPTKATAIGQLVSNPTIMINSAADNWIWKYLPTKANENPKFRLLESFSGGKNIFFFANKNVFDYMNPSDPRIPKYFEKGPSAATYIAVNSEQEADATTSIISNYLYRIDAPSYLYTYQEILFFEAEAYARGLGVTKDLAKAQLLYNQGLSAAFTLYGADPAASSTYLATQLPNLSTIADPVKEIHLQQWIDLMDRPIEAFTQWRRSGSAGAEVPVLTIPPGAPAGGLFRRYEYPDVERTANPNIPTPIPPYNLKTWFDL
ncbi:MAG TPA: SusD/RagB family nutrient-binding outer membrane lipoprotein [Chitinophagaceae bacterium]